MSKKSKDVYCVVVRAGTQERRSESSHDHAEIYTALECNQDRGSWSEIEAETHELAMVATLIFLHVYGHRRSKLHGL